MKLSKLREIVKEAILEESKEFDGPTENEVQYAVDNIKTGATAVLYGLKIKKIDDDKYYVLTTNWVEHTRKEMAEELYRQFEGHFRRPSTPGQAGYTTLNKKF